MGVLHLSHELRLLRCTFTDSSESLTPQPDAGNDTEVQDCAAGPDFDASLQSMVEHIENGEYFRAFGLQAVLVLLGVELNGAAVESRDWFKAQEAGIKAIVTNQVKFELHLRICFLVSSNFVSNHQVVKQHRVFKLYVNQCIFQLSMVSKGRFLLELEWMKMKRHIMFSS